MNFDDLNSEQKVEYRRVKTWGRSFNMAQSVKALIQKKRNATLITAQDVLEDL